MKRRFLSIVALLAMGMAMVFTSCSNDEDVVNTGIVSDEDATQQIVLQVTNTGDGLTTRAGRLLDSSEAAQDIDKVKVIICNETGSNNVVYVETVGWEDASDYPNGKEKVITLAGENKLTAGNYTVYAIGYSNSSSYTNLATDVEDITKGGTFNANVKLELGENNTKAEEIFAGSLKLTVEDGQGFRTPVVLNRQVAGTFGYVKDIPAMEGAAKLQLIACAANTSLILGDFASYDLTGNGTGNTGNINYVINGADADDAEEHVVYEVNLSDWFTDPTQDNDNDGIIDAGNNWKSEGHDKYAEGSVFAGTFLIPFSKVAETNTFILRLVNASSEFLREWIVKLPANDGQLDTHTLFTWGSGSFIENSSNMDTENLYNVVRNHLYGIGARISNTPSNPGEEDGDDPESLNTKQELVLRVNDNWEEIHNMTIE